MFAIRRKDNTFLERFIARVDSDMYLSYNLDTNSEMECIMKRLVKIFTVLLLAAAILLGIVTLALQNFALPAWHKHKTGISLALGALALLLFIVGRQPYAAVFAFVLLVIKALMLIKRQ